MRRPKVPRWGKNKSWVELRAEVHPSFAEPVANFLIEQGSPGIAQETVGKTGRRNRERLIAYYPNDRAFPAIRKRIRSYLRAICKPRRTAFHLGARTVRDENWAEAWKENFKPIAVTPGIVIKPPWETCPKKPDRIVIEIDPGMAFGTGTHPSTQMCLQFLEEIIPSFPRPPSVLDAGTGSGILAIAALKLGAGKIVAIDIDPAAVDCARANARANGAARAISFRTAEPEELPTPFDLVVANLLPQELLAVAPALTRLTARQGKLIISGFLARQGKEMARAFGKYGFEKQDARRRLGWAAWVLGRESGK